MPLKGSAPSSGTACSLELSLPSPAGIWFKTPLPVGGTNTAPLTPANQGEMVSHHPDVLAEAPRLQWPGVWGSPMAMENHGIPTKPVGGLLSNIGKVAPALG